MEKVWNLTFCEQYLTRFSSLFDFWCFCERYFTDSVHIVAGCNLSSSSSLQAPPLAANNFNAEVRMWWPTSISTAVIQTTNSLCELLPLDLAIKVKIFRTDTPSAQCALFSMNSIDCIKTRHFWVLSFYPIQRILPYFSTSVPWYNTSGFKGKPTQNSLLSSNVLIPCFVGYRRSFLESIMWQYRSISPLKSFLNLI